MVKQHWVNLSRFSSGQSCPVGDCRHVVVDIMYFAIGLTIADDGPASSQHWVNYCGDGSDVAPVAETG